MNNNYPPGVSGYDIEGPQIVNREFMMTLTTGVVVEVEVSGSDMYPEIEVVFADDDRLNAEIVFDGDDWAKFWKIATRP